MVDVDGGDDYVGEVDAGLGDEGQDGDGFAVGVMVSLEVCNDARERAGGCWKRRHFAVKVFIIDRSMKYGFDSLKTWCLSARQLQWMGP
jgi:hypothetical protein